MQLWKNTALTSVAALLGLFLLPLAVAREPAEVPEYTELPRTEQTAPVQPAVKAVYDADRTLRVLDGETVREMTLADYLVGVTAAEMPASFAEEALPDRGAEGAGGGSPYLYPLQADSRQQPRGHGGHLHGLYLLSGVYRHGAGPGQLGGTGGRL